MSRNSGKEVWSTGHPTVVHPTLIHSVAFLIVSPDQFYLLVRLDWESVRVRPALPKSRDRKYLKDHIMCGAWWLISRFSAFRSKSHRFKFPSRRHLGNLGKSFTRSCLQRFGMN